MSAASRRLTHCCDCERPFSAPVSEETALEYFAEPEDVAFVCETCAPHWDVPEPEFPRA